MYNNTFEQRTDGFWYAPAKDPADVLDYQVDLTGLMGGDTSDSISSVNVTIDDPTQSLSLEQPPVVSHQQFSLWFAGGVNGTTCHINFVARMQSGRVIDRDFKLEIRDL